jgi:FKBP-type peptidyl-prolyl cis-trans isomerase SlpA
MDMLGLQSVVDSVCQAYPMTEIPQMVGPDSYLTLRYRVCLPDGTEAVSTFGMNPATLALGSGQLAESLERCLIGMRVGERRAYTLEPEAGFGMKNPDLIQRIALSALPRELDEGVGAQVAFTDASGAEFAGTLLEKSDRHAVFDFNHPLAGRTVVFEAEIIGVM